MVRTVAEEGWRIIRQSRRGGRSVRAVGVRWRETQGEGRRRQEEEKERYEERVG